MADADDRKTGSTCSDAACLSDDPTPTLPPSGQSRRRWLAASAAAAAGSWIACSGDGNTTAEGDCVVESPPPQSLPGFDAQQCLTDVSVPSVPEDDQRFVAWNEELRDRASGRESAFVDLDAIDHNLQRVGERLGSRIQLRLVAKSLPSVRLLEYMMITACTNRVMAFSEGMVRDLLCRFGSDVDILLGRPQPAAAAARTFDTLDAVSSGENPATGVRWLVDTEARTQNFADLAAERGETIRVAVEIDVGLRRGGAIDEDELLAMLGVIDGADLLEFAGFMGYDGHVPFAPDGIDPEVEFAAVQERYADFVAAGRDAFPAMFDDATLYNGGGSRTYHLYTNDLDTPINEVAMGSAFFYPSNFADLPDTELRRATFFATPVLKRIDPAEVPFARGFLPGAAASDPNLEVAFFLRSAGYPADFVYPSGLVQNPLNPGSAEVINLLSNQPEWLGARELPLEVDDFVFYHPWEGDGVRWLSRLDVFRGPSLIDQWSTFEPGIVFRP